MTKIEKILSIIGILVTVFGIVIGVYSIIPNDREKKITQIFDKLNNVVRIVEYKDDINKEDLLYLATLVEAISIISMQKEVYINGLVVKNKKVDNKLISKLKFDNGLVVKTLVRNYVSTSEKDSSWLFNITTILRYPGGFGGVEKISYCSTNSNIENYCMFQENLSNLSIANFISILNQSGIIITNEKKVNASITEISIKDINSGIEVVTSMDKQKMILTTALTGQNL